MSRISDPDAPYAQRSAVVILEWIGTEDPMSVLGLAVINLSEGARWQPHNFQRLVTIQALQAGHIGFTITSAVTEKRLLAACILHITYLGKYCG